MREIIAESSFDEAVEALGGYRLVDEAMRSVYPALTSNPYGFKLFDSEFTSFRYAVTKAILWANPPTPPLAVIFTIDEAGNVRLRHIEIFEVI